MQQSLSHTTLIQAGAVYLALALGLLLLYLINRIRDGGISGTTEDPAAGPSGFQVFCVTNIIVAALTLLDVCSLTPLLSLFWSLMVVAALVATVIVVRLFAFSDLREENRSLKVLLFGFELSPADKSWKLTHYLEDLSLITLGLLCMAFAYAQYEKYGFITRNMGVFVLFWWGYLAIRFSRPSAGTENAGRENNRLGLLRAWRQLAVVPFLYSTGGWFLIDHGVLWEPSAWKVIAIVTIYLIAVAFWSSTLEQRARFVRNPRSRIWGQVAQSVDGRFLTSGWWRLGRKIDYTGELLVLVCIALSGGFTHTLPLIVPAFHLFYLLHRSRQEETYARSTFGQSWDKYCTRVPYRFFPLIY